MRTFYYITEAGHQYGLGHLRRYEALKSNLPDIKIDLILYEDSANPEKVKTWSNDRVDEVRCLVAAANGLFFDSFVASEEIIQEVEKSRKIIVIDDFLRRDWTRGLIIDWTLDCDKWRAPVGEKSLFGINYLLTRPAFERYRWNVAKKRCEGGLKIGTVFGGSDHLNITKFIYQNFKDYKNITHFGTSLYPSYVTCKHNEKFKWDLTESELAKELSTCDIVVTAGGQMLYELSKMCIPSICVSTIDNQDEDYNAFLARGLTIPILLSDIKTEKLRKNIEVISDDILKGIYYKYQEIQGSRKNLIAEIRDYLCI